MGTEESGHHLFKSIFEVSPVSRFLNITGINPYSIAHTLWNHWERERSLFSSVVSPKEVDGNERFKEVVNSLRLVDTAVRTSSVPPPPMGWSVPINTGTGSRGAGMLSYPNFWGQTKALMYPDIAALYAACEEANVVCEHILIHRDPYELLRGTVRKHRYYKNIRQGAKTLVSMVAVMTVEMLKFPTQTAGCWDYDSGKGRSAVARMLGWDPEGEEWRLAWDSIYSPADTMTPEERDVVVPPSERVYVGALMSSVELMVNTCHMFLGKKAGTVV